jgi:hypothetical protein
MDERYAWCPSRLQNYVKLRSSSSLNYLTENPPLLCPYTVHWFQLMMDFKGKGVALFDLWVMLFIANPHYRQLGPGSEPQLIKEVDKYSQNIPRNRTAFISLKPT